jgi:hypothetical protein
LVEATAAEEVLDELMVDEELHGDDALDEVLVLHYEVT